MNREPVLKLITTGSFFRPLLEIFKTKPNHEVSPDLKEKIRTVFHHLTKDELIEKMLASYLLQRKSDLIIKAEVPVKKRR